MFVLYSDAKFVSSLLQNSIVDLLKAHPRCTLLASATRVKDRQRAVQKAMWHFKGDLRFVTDFVRTGVKCPTIATLVAFLKALIACREIDIVSCDDTITSKDARFDEYRQLTLKVKLCTLPHICEIELHHSSLYRQHTEDAIQGYRRVLDILSIRTGNPVVPFVHCRPPAQIEEAMADLGVPEETVKDMIQQTQDMSSAEEENGGEAHAQATLNFKISKRNSTYERKFNFFKIELVLPVFLLDLAKMQRQIASLVLEDTMIRTQEKLDPEAAADRKARLQAPSNFTAENMDPRGGDVPQPIKLGQFGAQSYVQEGSPVPGAKKGASDTDNV